MEKKEPTLPRARLQYKTATYVESHDSGTPSDFNGT